METEVADLAVALATVLLARPTVECAELVAWLLLVARSGEIKVLDLVAVLAAVAGVALAMRRHVPRHTPGLALAVVWPSWVPLSQLALVAHSYLRLMHKHANSLFVLVFYVWVR